jgi:hypothetical protein
MKLPTTKFYSHGTFKTESRAQASAAKWTKSDPTRTFFVKKRQCKTVCGGAKTRYTVTSIR